MQFAATHKYSLAAPFPSKSLYRYAALQGPTLMPQNMLLQVLRYDKKMYSTQIDQMQLPVLLPHLQYHFDFRIQCLQPAAGIGDVKVLLHSSKSSIPLLAAVVKMPLSEMEEE